jgi:hypothetical protein
VIWTLFFAVGYTYGPLLGLFAFGMILKRSVNDKAVPWIAVVSPVSCYLLNQYLVSQEIKLGLAILLLNGLLTFVLCLLFPKPKK